MVKAILFMVFFFNFLLSEVDNFDFEVESNRIVNKYLNELKKKEKIFCTGKGGGSRGEINRISIDWDSNRVVSVDEARRLIVSATEDLLKRFNENKVIRPYLHNYPFDISNVDLHIRFNKNITDPRQVSFVSLGNAKIHYCNFDAKGHLSSGLHNETYEEALKIFRLNISLGNYGKEA